MGSAGTGLLFKFGRFPPPRKGVTPGLLLGPAKGVIFSVDNSLYFLFDPYFLINMFSVPHFFWDVLSPKAERPFCLAPLCHLNRSRVALAKIKPGRPSAGVKKYLFYASPFWKLSAPKKVSGVRKLSGVPA